MVSAALKTGDVDSAKSLIQKASEAVTGVEKEIDPRVQQNKIATAAAEGKARAAIQNGGLGTYSVPAGATGEAALANVDPATAATVRLVGDSGADFATIASRMTPLAKTNLAALVKAYNPNYNQASFGVEKKVQEKYTSGNVSDQLLAINTAREHMKLFSNLADALDNGDVQGLNKIGNSLGIQFGSDKTTNFNIASQAFGGEVGKALDGAGVVAGERKQAQENFNAQMSKGQFKGAAQTVDALLAGKQKAANRVLGIGQILYGY